MFTFFIGMILHTIGYNYQRWGYRVLGNGLPFVAYALVGGSLCALMVGGVSEILCKRRRGSCFALS